MEEFKFLNPKKMLHPKNGMTLEYLDKQSAIAALIVSHDGKKGYFVKQFRPGIMGETIEVVAGLIDPGEVPMETLYREVKEEAGIEVNAEMIIAMLDVTKNQDKVIPYGITKIFVLCSYISGKFEKNIETIDSGYFGIDELPELANNKTTFEQIQMCFEANKNKDNWKVIFD